MGKGLPISSLFLNRESHYFGSLEWGPSVHHRYQKFHLGFSLVSRIRALKLSEHEMALISCLSIFNPENLSSKLVSPADEKDLSLNKEIIFNILRILTREKYPKSHYRRLAALVSIISELQAFHMNNMTTWEKFLTFKVSQSPGKFSSLSVFYHWILKEPGFTFL